ncbi:MAG: hypothetical protein A2V66_10765 [Ignavibacteria bacterium RBG_13_36_8]|nr:MAG: hypothetical protein A2V66_10765 [Ignavibacteria bacterium RBG_13_36_8]
MITAEQLANMLVNGMGEAGVQTIAHTNFTNVLKDYLVPNIEVKGTYQGNIPGSPPTPDPLNGEYIWKVNSWDVSVSALIDGATFEGLVGWKMQLKDEMSKITILGKDIEEKITTTSPMVLSINSLYINFASKPNKMEDAMLKVAEGIVAAIKGALKQPAQVPATSINNGMGTVTWGVIS